ncbi:hypothetical protein OEG84_10170 [Hoeflea sp. G2-23]|uniref:Uncharacterized protein n=1 Tax=Hoeflea algicola TaxID=2983763 RepID=A0ABT3Z8L0_9HYPH|nr:hypothetical protein [Hoeflea algicola]MCY0148064.1 hypothetical protein [Hoeflea algicola]
MSTPIWVSLLKQLLAKADELFIFCRRVFMRTILSGVAPTAALLWLFVLSGATSVVAQQLDVHIIERASEDLDTCSYGQVAGLKAGVMVSSPCEKAPVPIMPKLTS